MGDEVLEQTTVYVLVKAIMLSSSYVVFNVLQNFITVFVH